MPAQIRPNRLEVTDRFPMLGFTIRTDGSAQRAEVVVTNDPALLLPQHKTRRTGANFHSSRGSGPLTIPRGEAVYVVPPEVLARFIGSERLYVALATAPEGSGGAMRVDVLPGAESPYVSLKGLTGRSLRRVRLLPSRQQRAAGYGEKNGATLEWAGDAAVPGMEKAGTPPAAAAPAPQVDYDDGFGPMAPAAPKAGNGAAGPAQAMPGQAAPGAQTLADDDDARGIEGPIPDAPSGTATEAAIAFEAEAAEYPQASRFVPAARSNYRAGKGTRTIDKVVLHITDGGAGMAGPISWFRNPEARVSAHYVIGRDGEVVQMVRHDDIAWHAGRANGASIGIEHVANTRGLNPTDEQLAASAALVAWLCARYALPIDRDHVLGHAEADPRTTHTGCPNAVWHWDTYMPLVQAAAGTATQQGYATAQEIIQPFYDPADPMSALTCQNDAFSLAREEWFVGVPNARIFPHSAICLLEMKDAAGRLAGRGTGFYIGPNTVLTCAHNLHGQASVDIVPAKDEGSEPFGRCNVSSSSWRLSNRYPAAGSDFDLAVIDDVPIAAPDGRWLEFLRQTPGPDMEVVVCGYSSRSDAVPELTRAISGFRQHLHAGRVRRAAAETFDYPILTLKRASGSPVYHISGSGAAINAYVCGVHVSSAPSTEGLNRGCFLTPDKLDWIEGRTTTLGQRAARAFDVPLDPGTGGRSIGVDALAPADIIVTTARHPVSYAIRGGTLSAVSHAMLYVGDGRVIEAIGSGVREVPLQAALADAILAVAYRDPQVTPQSAQRIVDHARSRVGAPYNYGGVAFTGYRLLNPIGTRIVDRIAERLGLEVGLAGATYCSELVFEAFEHGGVPLTGTRPGASTPEDIVELRRARLQYVGHLVAEDFPLGIPLGMAVAQGVAAARPVRALDWSLMSIAAERTRVAPPPVRRLSTAQALAVGALMSALPAPLGALVGPLRTAQRAAGVSVGIGPAVGAGLGVGFTIGSGLILGRDGDFGVYGSAEIDIGFISSISATAQLTVVRGGIDAFDGWSLAAAVSGGEGLVGGAAALFDTAGNFQGVSVQLGVGAGLSPVDFYIAIQRQVATQLSLSLARLMAAGEPRLFDVNAVPPSAAAPTPPAVPAGRRTDSGEAGRVRWRLEQYDGLRAPPQPGTAAPGERRVALDDWPFVPGASGPTRLPLVVSWRWQQGALGDIHVRPGAPQAADGQTLEVVATLRDGPDAPQLAAARLEIHYRFGPEPGVGALTTLTLYGDGTYERQDRWESALAAAA